MQGGKFEVAMPMVGEKFRQNFKKVLTGTGSYFRDSVKGNEFDSRVVFISQDRIDLDTQLRFEVQKVEQGLRVFATGLFCFHAGMNAQIQVLRSAHGFHLEGLQMSSGHFSFLQRVG